MRCPRRGTLLTALVLALVTLPLVAGAQQPRAERPTYAVGDTWALADATYRLARIQRGAYVFTADDAEIWFSRDLTLQFVRRGGESIELDVPQGLRWPLEVGRRGAGIGLVRFRGSESGKVEVYTAWRVVDYEEVAVAGGRVPAFRIVHTFDPEIPGRFNTNPYQQYEPIARAARFEFTVWYAPSVQRLEGILPLTKVRVR